jgi:hypothetical protein
MSVRVGAHRIQYYCVGVFTSQVQLWSGEHLHQDSQGIIPPMREYGNRLSEEYRRSPRAASLGRIVSIIALILRNSQPRILQSRPVPSPFACDFVEQH